MLKIKSIKVKKISNIYKGNKIYGNKSSSIINIKTNIKKIEGYGETYLSVYVPNIVKFIINSFAKKLIGKNPLEIEKILSELKIPFVSHNGLIKGLTAGIEIALWDIKSKFLKKPLYELLNNKYYKNVKCYASSGALKLNQNQIIKDVKNIKMDGFNAYKMRIGKSNWEKDIKRVLSAKKTLKKGFLMVDAIMGSHNQKWTLKQAITKIKLLSKYKLTWIEEPLDPFNHFDYSIIKKKSKLKIAFGEQFTTSEEFISAIKNNCSDYIQPDITMIGYTDAKRIIPHVNKNRKKIALHVWGSPISLLSNLHFALAFKEVEWIEIPYTNFNKLSKKLNNNIEIKNGNIRFKSKEFFGLGYK